MLTRDLVLRICATATELDHEWVRLDRKVVAPFTASRDTSLIERTVAAARRMGVEHLLICRTRSEHAYEPVTQVRATTPSLIGVIRGWGDEPTDFLVCLEDFSAAVLVTSGELTVAAGPADYVSALVGSDIGGVRAEFAEEARTRRESDLLRAAHRYGCLEQGGRHARTARGPGPDLAERVMGRVAAVRGSAPATAALLRALRGAWGWAMLLVLATALLFVPGVSGVLPAVLMTVWLLAQLAWLARSRTVDFATLLRLAVLGALMAWPIAFLELSAAAMAGLDPTGQYAYAYVAVPVEEAAKFTPVLLFWLVARRRFKRFAAVDYLLVAAASGAGFHLAETIARTLVAGGLPDPLLPQGGLLTLLPGWVELPGLGIRFSGHAVTTGLVGAAFGLAAVGRRLHGAWLWLLPPLAFGAAALEHLNYNAALAGLEPTAITSVVFALYGSGAATRWLLLALLLLAVVLDLRLARSAAESTPPLPGATPLRPLAAKAYGHAVWRRSHLAGDIAPAFRRIALAWARAPVTLVETAASILHEYALLAAAASRGPVALCAAWRFLPRRREHAMGAARAAGKPRRRVPAREELAAERDRLAGALGLGAVFTAAAACLVFPPLGAASPGPAAAYAVMTVHTLEGWFATLSTADSRWALAGAAALLLLLSTGWTVPRDHPSLRHFLRDPRGNVSGFLGALAPGQLPYAAAGLAGMLLPRTLPAKLLGTEPPEPLPRPR